MGTSKDLRTFGSPSLSILGQRYSLRIIPRGCIHSRPSLLESSSVSIPSNGDPSCNLAIIYRGSLKNDSKATLAEVPGFRKVNRRLAKRSDFIRSDLE